MPSTPLYIESRSPAPAGLAPLLAVQDLGKSFGRRMALRGVTLSIARGSCLALLGPNGAGKSTLLRIVAGLARPTSGRVLFEGDSERVSERLRPLLGFVGHQTLLYDALTARQNLLFFARLYGVADAATRADELLRRVGLERHADRPVGTFSRGMQQRLALARALVHRPSVLLLDEPAAGLDAAGASLLASTLRELRPSGVTILLVTHAFEGIPEVADQLAILAGGELRHHGPRGDLSGAGLARLYDTVVSVSAPGRAQARTESGAGRLGEAPIDAEPLMPRGAERPAKRRDGSGPSAAAGRVAALFAKDLLLEWRRKERVAAMAVFAFLAIVLFVFAVDPTPAELTRLGPGALWISFLFAGTLGLAKVFAPEERNGAMTALLLAPVDRTGLFLAKASAAALFMGAMEALMTPLFFAMFDLPLLHILPRVALTAALATAGFCLIGSLLAFVTSRAAARELLLPILLLPMTLPLLIAAAKATRILLDAREGAFIADLHLWLTLMAAFDVVFGVLCCWGFERAVEE